MRYICWYFFSSSVFAFIVKVTWLHQTNYTVHCTHYLIRRKEYMPLKDSKIRIRMATSKNDPRTYCNWKHIGLVKTTSRKCEIKRLQYNLSLQFIYKMSCYFGIKFYHHCVHGVKKYHYCCVERFKFAFRFMHV